MSLSDRLLRPPGNCFASVDGIYNGNESPDGTEDCYGSFQLHGNDGNTIFAYNAWSSTTTVCTLLDPLDASVGCVLSVCDMAC